MQQNEVRDCLECRIVGVTTFSALATYAGYLLATAPKTVGKGHKLFYAFMIVTNSSLAIMRAKMK